MKTEDDQIYLFRTGLNRFLMEQGGLRDILEDPGIIKIMHGAELDISAMSRDGIDFWGIYDTNLAHKIVRYQLEGKNPATKRDNSSLNSLCETYGATLNPVKESMVNEPWIRWSNWVA